METQGATNNQRLMAAAREDSVDLLLEIFDQGHFDINFQDGLGNTALHYAASHGSLDVLEYILSHEECDVDPINRLEAATPLHLAVVVENPEVREAVVSSLLDAGADTSIKNKLGDIAVNLIPAQDSQTRSLFRKVQAHASISRADVANDNDSGSDSGSDEE